MAQEWAVLPTPGICWKGAPTHNPHGHHTRSDIRQKNDFHPARRKINTKAKTRLNVLRALTNTTFGQSKEDITLVYKQYIRSILT